VVQVRRIGEGASILLEREFRAGWGEIVIPFESGSN